MNFKKMRLVMAAIALILIIGIILMMTGVISCKYSPLFSIGSILYLFATCIVLKKYGKK